MVIRSNHSPRVTRKREARINEILNGAMEIVVADGLEALTIQRLADKFQFTVGALYRYFRSKDDLVSALGCKAINTLQEHIKERVALCEKDALSDPNKKSSYLIPILGAAHVYMELFEKEPGIYRLLGTMLGDPREFLEIEHAIPIIEATTSVLKTLESYFQRAEEARVLEPANNPNRAVIFWASLQGINQLKKLERVPAIQFRSTMISYKFQESILLGWGATMAMLKESRSSYQEILRKYSLSEYLAE